MEFIGQLDQTLGNRLLPQAAEIDMGRQIALAQLLQHAVVALMPAIAAQGAGSPFRRETLIAIETVIRNPNVTVERGPGQLSEPVKRRQANFDRVSFSEIGRQTGRFGNEAGVVDRAFNKVKAPGRVPLHAQLPPGIGRPAQEVHRHGVRQLVADKKRWQCRQIRKILHPIHPAGKTGETLALDGGITRVGFNQPETEFPRLKQVGSELTVVGSLFDDHKIARLPQLAMDLAGEVGQQPAVQRPDTDRRVKIPRPANPPGARPVISLFRMIERQLHDPGKIQTPGRSLGESGVKEVGEVGHGKALAGDRERL